MAGTQLIESEKRRTNEWQPLRTLWNSEPICSRVSQCLSCNRYQHRYDAHQQVRCRTVAPKKQLSKIYSENTQKIQNIFYGSRCRGEERVEIIKNQKVPSRVRQSNSVWRYQRNGSPRKQMVPSWQDARVYNSECKEGRFLKDFGNPGIKCELQEKAFTQTSNPQLRNYKIKNNI